MALRSAQGVQARRQREESASCRDSYGIEINTWRSDPALVRERQQANAAAQFRAVSFEVLKKGPTLPARAAQVLARGRSVWLSVALDLKAWSAVRHKPRAVLEDWENNSGGHAVVLVGFRTTPSGRQFLIHNSWGTDWGDNGYAWISETMLRERSLDAFVIAAGDVSGRSLPTRPLPTTKTGPTTPVPPPPGVLPPVPFPFPFLLPGLEKTPVPPSAAVCAAGQVRDALFGTWSAACGGGGSPVAGLCPTLPGTTGGTATPTRPDCGAGEARDVMTGSCQPKCPSGAPRAAGVCWM